MLQLFISRMLAFAVLLCCCSHSPASGLVIPPGARVFSGDARTALAPQLLRTASRRTQPVMMAKKVTKLIKLALQAGKANPAPPVGPALGAAGVNIMMFCKEYNARTSDKAGTVIPVEISVFDDRSFTFILKTPPASELLKKAAGVPKGSGIPFGRGATVAGTVTKAQVSSMLLFCTQCVHCPPCSYGEGRPGPFTSINSAQPISPRYVRTARLGAAG